jgi:hypothetical protein
VDLNHRPLGYEPNRTTPKTGIFSAFPARLSPT